MSEETYPMPQYGLSDVERYLGLAKNTSYRWVREGKLKATRDASGHYHVSIPEFYRFAAELKNK
jgi:excisionase family DNA binding protein